MAMSLLYSPGNLLQGINVAGNSFWRATGRGWRRLPEIDQSTIFALLTIEEQMELNLIPFFEFRCARDSWFPTEKNQA